MVQITKEPVDTKKSEQVILNNSYDTDFKVLAIELVGFDASTQTLQRIMVDTSGKLDVTI